MSDFDKKTDDGTTVVINIKDLKKRFEADATATSIGELNDLEFGTDIGNVPSETKVILFDYKSNTLESLKSKALFPKESLIAKDLNALKAALKEAPDSYIVFNYHVERAAISKLLSQIKSIYKNSHTVLMAKGLVPEIIEKHKKTPSKADIYLNFPFKAQDFLDLTK